MSLLSIAEVAAILRCSQSTIRRLYDDRAERVGDRRAYTPEAVAMMVAERASKTASRGRRRVP